MHSCVAHVTSLGFLHSSSPVGHLLGAIRGWSQLRVHGTLPWLSHTPIQQACNAYWTIPGPWICRTSWMLRTWPGISSSWGLENPFHFGTGRPCLEGLDTWERGVMFLWGRRLEWFLGTAYVKICLNLQFPAVGAFYATSFFRASC